MEAHLQPKGRPPLATLGDRPASHILPPAATRRRPAAANGLLLPVLPRQHQARPQPLRGVQGCERPVLLLHR